ncbi:MAG: glycosyltransferase family 4 protein [Acidimicrobiia bacterium]|nr:glycosyltransferase family 4 protein [Acidimicrobiia bacterium]MYC46697.1 glycosyltransferase family 4 protein [Acidimicrobiia bacterium]
MRIALLTYRGKPHCGGQGVYTRQLSRALVDLGHHVEVFSGQPYPELDGRVPLWQLPSLDIFNDHFPGRRPAFWEIKTAADRLEVWATRLGVFSEPLAFSVRAWQELRRRAEDFDLVHDNQSLGYGLLAVQRAGLPIIATIHHPITVDRRLEMAQAKTRQERFGKKRWYSFTRMQTRVAKRLPRVLTVSESSMTDIVRDHRVPPERINVVPVGVDPEVFRPLPGVLREDARLVTTASADVAMKGMAYLLEALSILREGGRKVTLTVIGRPRADSATLETIRLMGLSDAVRFVSDLSEADIVNLYAEASVAVVPSLYEGFSLPAIEAMSCAVPLVTTTGGALPEVVGPDGEAALLVPPGDAPSLAGALRRVLDDPDLGRRLGQGGRRRVLDNWSWRHTAERTVEQYRILLAGAGRRPAR